MKGFISILKQKEEVTLGRLLKAKISFHWVRRLKIAYINRTF